MGESVNHAVDISHSYQRADHYGLKKQGHETTFRAIQTTL